MESQEEEVADEGDGLPVPLVPVLHDEDDHIKNLPLWTRPSPLTLASH